MAKKMHKKTKNMKMKQPDRRLSLGFKFLSAVVVLVMILFTVALAFGLFYLNPVP